MTNVLSFAAGLLAGALYFRCVWWNARLFANGGGMAATLLLMLGRLLLLGCLLTLASRFGALPLLLMALGVLLARAAVLRRFGVVTP